MASIGVTPRIVAGVAVITWLFVAQRNDRIYRRRWLRGNVRRGGSHNQHQNRDTPIWTPPQTIASCLPLSAGSTSPAACSQKLPSRCRAGYSAPVSMYRMVRPTFSSTRA
jgi:hypothetical protein